MSLLSQAGFGSVNPSLTQPGGNPMEPWRIADFGDFHLEYQQLGTGEPLVLIHAAVVGDFFSPLVKEPALAERYHIVTYHRAGYGNSSRLTGPMSTRDQAAHTLMILDKLEIEQAHVAGHSDAGMICLQLALDTPERVQSIALLEAARPARPSDAETWFRETVAMPANQRYQAGDHAGAVDTWMNGVCEPDCREALEVAIPGAFDRAVADAPVFFEQALPAVREWSFTAEDATRITQPVLAIVGEHSIAPFWERQALLAEWLPNIETAVLPGASHLLHVQNPGGMAELLAAFFARHPMHPAD
jgi:pimeloyl-ACP methyl ester carboxylesterase